MKGLLIIMGILFFSSFAVACDSGEFTIYYLPLEAEFYVPPTREDIMKNGNAVEIDSCLLYALFADIRTQDGHKSSRNDITGLRILIIEKTTNEELFITNKKTIISIRDGKKYDLKINVIDEIIKEIIGATKNS